MEIEIFPCENATEEIQNAINRVSASGGGRVVINDGEYLIKSILLKSGTTLYLKSGAYVKGSRNPEDYDLSAVITCPAGVDYYSEENCAIAYLNRGYNKKPTRSLDPFSRWSRAMIKAYRAKNIAVIGEKGATFDGQDVYDEQGEEQYRGPHFINFHECENITLKGYTLKNSSNWGNAIFTSTGIVIDGLTVLGGHDGIDIMSCDNVVIKNCDLKTGDDCVAGFDNINVFVENCRLNSSCNALRIGGHNFRVKNCVIYGDGLYGHRYFLPKEDKIRGVIADPAKTRCNMEAAVNYYCDDRFKVRKPVSVFIENCTIENCGKLIDYGFTNPKKRWIKNKPMEFMQFKNVSAKGVKGASELYAPSDLKFNVEFIDCEFDVSGEIFAEFENTDFKFKNVNLKGADSVKDLNGKVVKIKDL